MRRLAAATSVVVLFAAHSSLAWAQAGWSVTPSLSLTEGYDDNIFGLSSGKTSDFVTRLTPGIAVGYGTPTVTLRGRYALDAEIFAKHSDLNNVANNQRGSGDARYHLDPQTTLGLTGSYTQTETSADLLLQTDPQTGVTRLVGIDVGRRRATTYGGGPSVSYQLDPSTTLDASYAYTRNKVSGVSTDTAHEASLSVARQLTTLDRGTLRYRLGAFDSDVAGSTTAQTVLLGWTRQLTESTTATMEAGPRFSDGDTNAEATVRVQHRLAQAELSLAYTRAETLVVGRAGASTIDTVVGSVRYQPLRPLQLSMVASLAKIAGADDATSPDTTVYSLDASASYRITDWMSARLSYRFSRQEQGPGTIEHHIVALTLELAVPLRIER